MIRNLIVLFLFLFLLQSCGQPPHKGLPDNPAGQAPHKGLPDNPAGQAPHKDQPEHSDWTTLNLPNDWTIKAPENFRDSFLQGVDSDPGIVYSGSDSIYLDYDSGRGKKNPDCDFNKEVENAKNNSLLDLFNVRTGVSHRQYIDTIGNRVAAIIIPVKAGKGMVYLSMGDCSSGNWLGISGQNLSEEKQKLALEMFRTIAMKGDKK